MKRFYLYCFLAGIFIGFLILLLPEFREGSFHEPIEEPKDEIRCKIPPPLEEPEDDGLIISIKQSPPYYKCMACDSIKDQAERKACADREMLHFLYSEIRYPPIARETHIEGIVVIQFIIDKTGKMIDPKIAREIGGSCGQEALRVVQQMRDWIPATQFGRNVDVQFNLPVRFRLQ